MTGHTVSAAFACLLVLPGCSAPAAQGGPASAGSSEPAEAPSARPQAADAPAEELPPTIEALQALLKDPKTYSRIEGFVVDDHCFPLTAEAVKSMPEGGTLDGEDFAGINDPSVEGFRTLKKWLSARFAKEGIKFAYGRTDGEDGKGGWGAFCLRERIVSPSDLTFTQKPLGARMSAAALDRLRALGEDRKVCFVADGQVVANAQVVRLLKAKGITLE